MHVCVRACVSVCVCMCMCEWCMLHQAQHTDERAPGFHNRASVDEKQSQKYTHAHAHTNAITCTNTETCEVA